MICYLSDSIFITTRFCRESILVVHVRKQLLSSAEKRTFQVQECYNYLCTYDLYSPVLNVLDACISITRASGRGLGPVKWHRSDRRVSFGALKTRDFQGTTSSQLPK
jgi:hypothetical protein